MKHFLISSAFILLSSSAFAQTSASAETTSTEQPDSVETSPSVHEQVSNGQPEFPRNLMGVYGGIGIPHGLSAGLEYLHQSRLWSVAAEVGGYNYKPKDVDATKEEEFSIGNFEVVGRYHFTRSPFFFAAAIGAQKMKAKQKVESNGETIRPEVELKNIYVTPKVGWFWQFNSGVNFGVEFGAQIPVSSSESLNPGTDNAAIVSDPNFIQAQNDIRDLASTVGKHILPHALVRVGYAF